MKLMGGTLASDARWLADGMIGPNGPACRDLLNKAATAIEAGEEDQDTGVQLIVWATMNETTRGSGDMVAGRLRQYAEALGVSQEDRR